MSACSVVHREEEILDAVIEEDNSGILPVHVCVELYGLFFKREQCGFSSFFFISAGTVAMSRHFYWPIQKDVELYRLMYRAVLYAKIRSSSVW